MMTAGLADPPPIMLADILPIKDQSDYKLHFARADNTRPLDDFLLGWERWVGWQNYWPKAHAFNLPYIFALMDFHLEPDVWLFGGVFEVMAFHGDRYEVKLTDQGRAFIGRLKIRYRYKDRQTRPFLGKHFELMTVAEVLSEPFRGRAFPGYPQIDLGFDELETLVRLGRPDWKQALELVKGVYLITDTATGGRYVGSAYGQEGIWSRWCQYALTGHGGNVELRKLSPTGDVDYFRHNCRIVLLEHHTASASDDTIRQREVFWKTALMSRSLGHLNRN